MLKSEYLQRVYTQVVTRDPDQKEFHQAVLEVLESLDMIVEQHPEYEQKGIIETFVEPERMICFRVPWIDDKGAVRHTVVDGKVVVRDGKLVHGDIDEIRADAKKQADRLWEAMLKYPETYTYHYDDSHHVPPQRGAARIEATPK